MMTETDEGAKPRTVYWSGRQWCVTDYGLETVEPDRYYVGPEELGTLTQGAPGPMAERLRHIAEKTWVDIEDIAAAFAIAVQVHAGKFPPLPEGAFTAALEHVRRERWCEGEFNRLRTARGKGGVAVLGTAETFEMGDLADQAAARREAAGYSFSTVPDPAAKPDFMPVPDEDEEDEGDDSEI